MEEKFERSQVGRVFLSIVMLVLLGCLVLWNMPAGRPREEVRELVGPVLLPLGLDQDWSVFAPEPRAFSVGFLATVTYADGATRTWRPPATGKWIAPLRTYRWQKYDERVRADSYSGIWQEAAEFVARDAHRDGEPAVTRVQLLREYRPAVVPGSGEERPPMQVSQFYDWTAP